MLRRVAFQLLLVGLLHSSTASAGVDLHGDHLPPGALARLGTSRLRHDHSIQHLAYSQEGTKLTVAGGRTVSVWDADSGRRQFRFSLDSKTPLHPLAFSPHGQLVAAADDDGLIHLYEVSTGEQLHTLKGHPGTVVVAAFSPRGGVLASGGMDGTIRLWELRTGQERLCIPAPHHCRSALAFSPDGETLAAAGDNDTVCFWNPATGKELRRLKGPDQPIESIAFSADGKTLASAGREPFLRLWDAAT